MLYNRAAVFHSRQRNENTRAPFAYKGHNIAFGACCLSRSISGRLYVWAVLGEGAAAGLSCRFYRERELHDYGDQKTRALHLQPG